MFFNRQLSQQLQVIERDGVIVVKNVFTKIDCDKIISRLGEGSHAHSKLMWKIRTDPRVLDIFHKLWLTKDIITGYDGIGITKSSSKGLDWHVDQDPFNNPGKACVQAILAISKTDVTEFAIGSHLYHQELTQSCDRPQEWQFININEDSLKSFKKFKPKLEQGDMVIWDSRLTHRVIPKDNLLEKRVVAYLSFAPLSFADKETLEKRKMMYNLGVSSTHWPYRIIKRHDKFRPPLKSYDNASDDIKRLVDGNP